MERLIPRWAHPDLGAMIIKYLVYVRSTEEVFAEQLWGVDAAKVLRYSVFWRWEGKAYDVSDQFSNVLKGETMSYFGEDLNIQGESMFLTWYEHRLGTETWF